MGLQVVLREVQCVTDFVASMKKLTNAKMLESNTYTCDLKNSSIPACPKLDLPKELSLIKQ